MDDLQLDDVIRIYEYLGDAVGYCILNINSQYYDDDTTKKDLQEQKDYYDKQKTNYELMVE